MEQCPYLDGCAFFNHCRKNDVKVAIERFTQLYCKGDRREGCIRKRLAEAMNINLVPVDMMPNGYPLPGSDQENWSDEALNFRSIL